MHKEGGCSAAGPVEVQHAAEIHVQHQIPHQQQEIIGQLLPQVVKGAAGAQGRLLMKIADLRSEGAAVSEVLLYRLPQVAGDQDDLPDPVGQKAADLIFQDGLSQYRHHGLRKVLCDASEPGPLAPCHDHCFHTVLSSLSSGSCIRSRASSCTSSRSLVSRVEICMLMEKIFITRIKIMNRKRKFAVE